MHISTRNARNRLLDIRTDIGPDLLACGQRFTDELINHTEVLGVIAGGSCAHGVADGFSDLDLHIFGENLTDCERVIHDCCRALGGHPDSDAASIHFPLDSPGYLFGDLYLEPGATTIHEVEEELTQVLAARRRDDGRLYSLQNGILLADRSGDLHRLLETLAATKVSREYAEWFTDIALDVPVKLIIHSVHRGDYPHAWYWLVNFYYECVRILCARAGLFFPGIKRTLTHTLDTLPNMPDGFSLFWGDIFAHGVREWDAAVDYVVETAHHLKTLPQHAEML